MPCSRAVLSLSFSFLVSAMAQAASPTAPPIVLHVDASNVAQQLFSIRASIPAAPGKLTLLYPQWVPGNHGPSGP
ncbi:MAG: peptidase M61, partial [Janthinobacterium sp.]